MDLRSSKLKAFPVLQEIIDLAKQLIEPKKIILFGSRARSDYKTTSDYDLAFSCTDNPPKNWSRFCINVDEDVRSLCKFDLILIETAEKHLQEAIKNEGIIIYET